MSRSCGLTEHCACRGPEPQGVELGRRRRQGLKHQAKELGPCPKEQKTVVIKQELAPNSQRVRMEV